MRYNQEPTTTSLALDQPQQSHILGLYHPPVLEAAAQYAQDGSNYYQPTTHVYPGLDVRPRLGSNTTSSGAGMEHTPRTVGLPQPGTQPGTHVSARDQYSHATPSFRRPSEHPGRSPSFPGSQYRRPPISPSPSLTPGFTNSTGRMDSQFTNRSAQNSIPPLEDIQVLGTLQYTDHHKTNVEVKIRGTIDKGFFLAEKEWTCYRRNYFSCVCSYSLVPYIPNVPIEMTMPASRPAMVCGFAMSISAVVADNDQHSIDLVQHTPKRDKGPTKSPPKVHLMAKQDPSAHHVSFYPNNPTMSGQSVYPDGWVPAESGGNGPQTEHTFERIQFKQATQNNGKRRAAQQYYHILVELFANTRTPNNPNYVKIAYRKSAKMIVRGRSPGHYQNDRRGSSSNGPPGSSGNSGTYGVMGGVRDFGSGTFLQPYGGYDSQNSLYGAHRHHVLPPETMIPPEEEKAIENTKGYQYYPGTMCDGQNSQRVDLWNHHSESEPIGSHMIASIDINGKVKNEYENNALPRLVHPPSLTSDHSRACRPFDGKPTSNGYYPHVMSPSSMSITM